MRHQWTIANWEAQICYDILLADDRATSQPSFNKVFVSQPKDVYLFSIVPTPNWCCLLSVGNLHLPVGHSICYYIINFSLSTSWCCIYQYIINLAYCMANDDLSADWCWLHILLHVQHSTVSQLIFHHKKNNQQLIVLYMGKVELSEYYYKSWGICLPATIADSRILL